MQQFSILLFSILFLSISNVWCQADRTQVEEVINGVTLAMHSFDYTADYSEKVIEISQLGAEWIQVNIKFYQENIYSSRIVSDSGYEAYWIQFENILIKSKDQDLKVTILPIILLSNPSGSNWRGLIDPYDLEKWFRYYNKMILKIARLAEKHHVDMLTIGSELVNLQQYTSHWEELIQEVRNIFSGKINYAANWDVYQDIAFLDELDYLGLSGYFDLTENLDPSKWSLRNSWYGIKKRLLAFQEMHNIPIIFTELGYTSQDGTNMHPWNYYASEVVDLEEQKDCYEAFLAVWAEDEAFHGAIIYDWYDEGGPEDTGYTVRNKPAEKIVRQWFEQIKQ